MSSHPPDGPAPEHLLDACALAYQNVPFLNTPDARPLRFLAEYLEPLRRLRYENIHDTIVFFGSARIKSQAAAQAALDEFDYQNRVAALREGQPPDQVLAEARRRVQLKAVEFSRYYEDARALAHRLTGWARGLKHPRHRFVIASGGGPGIMEAANRGAAEAGGKTIGFNIQLPFEQHPNDFITPSLNFQFHYFFMRKFWFAYLAKALVAFPGGFGTLDEVTELLTLSQTQKLAKKIIIVLYGKSYWNEILNFDALVDWGTISPADLDLFHFVDTPAEAADYLIESLTRVHLQPPAEEEASPGIAKTR